MAKPPPEAPDRSFAKKLISSGVSEGTYLFADMSRGGTGTLRIALAGRERCGAGYRVEREDYPFYTLEYLAEGRGSLRRGQGPSLSLEPGCFYAFGPGLPHAISSDGGTLLKYFISLAGRDVRSRLNALGPVFGTPCRVSAHVELRELFDWILREGQEHSQKASAICRGLLDILLLKLGHSLAREEQGCGRARMRFLECKAHLETHAIRLATLSELCTDLHMDPSNLNRLFRRFQGCSPYHYLLRCKMNLAARELLGGAALVKEVALSLGYEDPYHFSRLFKAVHGVAPSEFRAGLRELSQGHRASSLPVRP